MIISKCDVAGCEDDTVGPLHPWCATHRDKILGALRSVPGKPTTEEWQFIWMQLTDEENLSYQRWDDNERRIDHIREKEFAADVAEGLEDGSVS